VPIPEPVLRRTTKLRAKVVHPLAHRAATLAVAGARQVLRYAYLGPGDADRLGFAEFGDASMVQQPYALLMGEPAIAIGSDTLISPGATLAASPEFDWTPTDGPMIRIGSRVWAARGLTVIAHRSIEIGDDVWFGPDVYLTDAGHDASDPDVPIGVGMEPAEPVRIGDESWIGTGVVVLPGVTIGRRVVVGANSVVTGDLPDHCVAVGSPAKVIRQL
jgi:acetyltransferase-like isoleucine patch superfamily enzyme